MEEERKTRDCREELINQICMYLMQCGVNAQDAKNNLYLMSESYEITSRCTQIAELKQDRNDYLLKQFLMAKTMSGCSKNTIRTYGTDIKKFLDDIGKTVDDITTEDIRNYLAIRQIRDRISKSYADTIRRYLSTFFNFLVDEEYIAKDPTRRIERIKRDKKKKKALTDIEIEKLRMNAIGEREKAVIEVLLSTGCRVSELTNIKLDDIDRERVLVHGKGAKERYCYLNAKAMVTLDAYLKLRKDDNPYLFAGGIDSMFKSGKISRSQKSKDWWKCPELVTPDTHLDRGAIERMLRNIAKRAGVERANPHKFRRTCATMALRRGMPIEQVSKMLGHEELTTTQIYLDLSEDELAQAHKKYVV